MTKTFAIAFAVASIAGLAAIVPAQAATRSVDINPDLFANRCIAHGGAVAAANPTLACETPDTVIVCSFMTINHAQCEWPGIDGQIAVNRIIGMQDAQAVDTSSGGPVKKGGGGGGGFQLPDLPIDNGGGGGGIDLPDFPIKWN